MNFSDLVKTTNKTKLGSKVETKGKFDYLSWAHAVHILGAAYPDFSFEVKHFPQIFTKVTKAEDANGEPYTASTEKYVLEGCTVPFMQTSQGFFVEVAVTANGVTRTQVHPVLDNSNRPLANPNSFQINTSIQRALAKAIALHGVGLSLYAGEDLEDL